MNGFGGGFNMQNLMRQAQKMQEDMKKAQEELESAEVVSVVGGGVVTVTMNGKKQLKSVKIDKAVVDPSDVETLEDLIVAGVNDAESKADKLAQEKMPAGVNGLMN
jgi:DNA-binding YbaB/EbfC family protein